jgi:predicted GIY-YIG superfamily endonuclease
METITGEQNYKVYQITNSINNKVYVGITKRDPEERWNNGKGYSYNKHFYNSIMKYGWINFNKEILKENLTEDQAKLYESFLISTQDSTNQNKGYNKATYSSSTGTTSNRFKVLDDETKDKISNKRTGNTLSPKRYKRLKQTHKHIRGSREIQKFNKKGILLDTYSSVGEAARANSLTKQNVSQAALGKQFSAGGFIFKFPDLEITERNYK